MPSIPLPFVVSLVLCLVLLRMVRQDNRFGLFPLLVAAFALQSALSGLNWSVGWPAARLFQPILASALPALAFAAFDRLRRDETADIGHLWPHLLPVATVAGLVAAWREPIDIALFAIYAGYGLALLRLAALGPSALAASRIGDERNAHRALVALGLLLCLTAFVDAAVSLDLALGEGRQASVILTVSAVLWLGAAGYAATVADASRPGDDSQAAEPSTAALAPPRAPGTVEATASEGDTAIARRIEALMRERHLYRDPDLTLERLARRAGIPARQISMALNRVHGRNVSQVVNGFRVEEARHRLVSTDAPITTVMLESGFGTKSNFNREFLRVTGMSPSDYRRSGGTVAAGGSGDQAAAPG